MTDAGEERWSDEAAASDAWLIARVCDDPPDARALDVLVQRHWNALAARCELLTLHREAARDLAQETWFRVLRARRALRSDGNFPAYLATIATNLWRNQYRSARRSGPLAADRLSSIDAPIPTDDGDAVMIGDAAADPRTLAWDEQTLLQIDLDRALARLDPRSRDVLIARYVDGESAAEIGRRYGRTEQSVTSWLRHAVGHLRDALSETRR